MSKIKFGIFDSYDRNNFLYVLTLVIYEQDLNWNKPFISNGITIRPEYYNSISRKASIYLKSNLFKDSLEKK